MNLPFQQIKDGNKLIRTFEPDIDSNELVWHRDKKDRIVRIIENEGWKFQKEDELPIDLEKNQKLFIKKEDWHRVLKGDGKLIVEIEEII
jgi:hypothetical protein